MKRRKEVSEQKKISSTACAMEEHDLCWGLWMSLTEREGMKVGMCECICHEKKQGVKT